MLDFMLNKKCIVKRYTHTLGEYNRPLKSLDTIGEYYCHIAESTSSTAQLQVQKDNTTDLTLYVDPEASIEVGDVLYIYELDEYDNIIEATELKALADKPYKKRTHLAVPLVFDEEV